ncbi:MAG: type III-B CRISPR module RAMP protein Cmr6, partial [Gammaproteobacteria bacterium]
LAINLGTESVLETSIALHHTYGVPYIPGSALKGLAASFAHQHLDGDEWRKESGWAHKELFGTTEQAGCVTFFDALYRPPEYFQQGKPITPLRPDIITVHHPEYYRGEDTPPSDWDSPTPIPFLTATGKYLFAISGPEEWVNVTFDILEHALEAKGIGAKTSSGYGRMSFVDDTPSVKMPLVKEFSPTRMPAPNDRFKGIVFDWDSKGVYLEIPGLDPDDFWAFIPASEYPSEHRFQSGQRIKCVVTKVNGDEIVCALD